MRALLAGGAGVEAADEEGATALHVAASAGQRPAAALLLRAGARAAARDACGRTPLSLARLFRPTDAAMIALLEEAEATGTAATATADAADAAAGALDAPADGARCEEDAPPALAAADAAAAAAAAAASPAADGAAASGVGGTGGAAPSLPSLSAHRARALAAPPRYGAHLLHPDPWIVQYDGLVTAAEARALLVKCEGRWKEARVKSASARAAAGARNSSFCWCTGDGPGHLGCRQSPLGRRLLARLAAASGVPPERSEAPQASRCDLLCTLSTPCTLCTRAPRAPIIHLPWSPVAAAALWPGRVLRHAP